MRRPIGCLTAAGRTTRPPSAAASIEVCKKGTRTGESDSCSGALRLRMAMSAGGVSLRNNVASAVVNIAAVFRSDFVYIPACWPVEFVRTGVQNIVGFICGLRCGLSAGTGSVSRRDAVVLCTLLCLRWCCRRLGRFGNRRVCRLRRRRRLWSRSRFRRCSRSRRCFGSDFGDRVGKLDVPRPFLHTRDSDDGAENDPESRQRQILAVLLSFFMLSVFKNQMDKEIGQTAIAMIQNKTGYVVLNEVMLGELFVGALLVGGFCAPAVCCACCFAEAA